MIKMGGCHKSLFNQKADDIGRDYSLESVFYQLNKADNIIGMILPLCHHGCQ